MVVKTTYKDTLEGYRGATGTLDFDGGYARFHLTGGQGARARVEEAGDDYVVITSYGEKYMVPMALLVIVDWVTATER